MSRILLGVTTIVLILVLGFAYRDTRKPPTPLTPVTVVNTQTISISYTLATVATHKNASSCWSAINGNVYDLTKWINQHPGGPARILSICGTDASAAFNDQHGGAPRPASELKNFLLGPLTK